MKKNYLIVFLCISAVVFGAQEKVFDSIQSLISYVDDHSVIVDLRSQAKLTDWDFFHTVVFSLPALLFTDDLKRKRVQVLIPQDLQGLTPIEDQSPFIEGIRTFLSIARVYYLSESNDHWELCIVPDQEQQESGNRSMIKHKIDPARYHISNETLPTDPVAITVSLENTVHSKGRVCISGGAGFLGSFFAKQLLHDGYQIIILDNLLCSSLENIKDIKDCANVCFVNHDVSIPFTLSVPVDAVIHLASVPSPVDYYKMPLETLRSGLQGTKNMLDLALQNNARFLFSSTSEIYGDPEVTPQPETYAGNVNFLGPRSQYDQSKRGAETLIKLYFDKYHLDVRIARIFNTYGPGMRLHDGRVITNFIAAILEDKPITIYGDGLQTRSFGYVQDTIQGLYDLMMLPVNTQESLFDRVFNIGTPTEFTISELAKRTEKISLKYLHKIPTIIRVANPDKTDPKMRCPDITKAQKRFYFNPQISLEQGLEKTFLYFFECKQQS